MKKSCFLLFIVAVIASSCTEGDFLDQTITSDLDEATVFADSTNTEKFFNNIYSDIGFADKPSRFGGWNGTTGGMQTASDEAEIRTTPDITTDLQFATGTINSTTVTDDAWKLSYANIRKVNQFLGHLDVIPLQQSTKTSRVAEARFLRAWYYSILLKHYGGVPLVGDKVFTSTDVVPTVRNTYSETVEYIVSELDAAAQNLPIRPINRDYGRAGKGACMALKTRVLLYAASPLHNGSDYSAPFNELLGYPNYDIERWNRAMKAAKDLIDTQSYKLYVDNVKQPGFGFYAIFNANAGGNITQDDQDATEGTILELMAGGGSDIERLLNPPSRNGGRGEGGYPYQELVDGFPMANGKEITDPSSGFDPDKPYENRDPRFYNTIIHDQFKLVSPGGNLEPVDIYLGNYQGQNAGQDAVHTGTPTGYYWMKFRNRDISGADALSSSQERPLIRYAEVLLAFAEAQNEYQGPTSDSYQVLKDIRRRAGIEAGVNDMYGLKVGMSQEEMRTAIRNEKRIEFALESHRFWDVRRWKIAETTENKIMTGMEVTRNGNFNPQFKRFDVRKHLFRSAMYFWPIPYSEIAKSPDLIQNPGY